MYSFMHATFIMKQSQNYRCLLNLSAVRVIVTGRTLEQVLFILGGERSMPCTDMMHGSAKGKRMYASINCPFKRDASTTLMLRHT